jgi:DNA-binding NarL/FixJ family response regulator
LDPPPALILLDPPIPFTRLPELRAEHVLAPDGSSIPVLLMSSARNIRQEAFALGVAGYLSKPIARQQLLTAVRHCNVPAAAHHQEERPQADHH